MRFFFETNSKELISKTFHFQGNKLPLQPK
jgi:hypothetical protein